MALPGEVVSDSPEARERRAKLAASGSRRLGLGEPLPVPAWAVATVGGSVMILLTVFAPMLGWIGGRAPAPSLAVALLPVIHGAACGGIATVATGRMDRRILRWGIGFGLTLGTLTAGALILHEALLLPVLIGAVSLPSALIAQALRLPWREAVPLWARALVAVASGSLPLGYAIHLGNRYVAHLPMEVMIHGIAAVVGGLSWYVPAAHRVRAQG